MREDLIRVRAYFHFENHTGKNWKDPISNWLQAEEEEGRSARAYEFFEELGRRAAFIRGLYRRYRVVLKPNEGLSLALEEAEALARGDKLEGLASAEQLHTIQSRAHVIYAFAETLKTCVDAGLDVSRHLPQMTTGSTDFGISSRDNKAIFFKDFEFELFIASALIRSGLVPALTGPGDPRGDPPIE